MSVDLPSAPVNRQSLLDYLEACEFDTVTFDRAPAVLRVVGVGDGVDVTVAFDVLVFLDAGRARGLLALRRRLPEEAKQRLNEPRPLLVSHDDVTSVHLCDVRQRTCRTHVGATVWRSVSAPV